ncbi:MAG: LysR substrate-binding domain-containing protein [Novosphingobium sp.]
MSRSPNLPALRFFVGVAKAKSFSVAAKEMNISQPALSRNIRMLEEGVGTTLFDRDTRNVRLTAAGEALLPVVQRLLTDFDHAFSELSLSFSGERGRVVVGALPSLAAGFLPKVIAEFRATHPGVEIAVVDTLSGAIETRFRERQVDLALIAQNQESDDIAFLPIFDEEFGLICQATDELAESSDVTWDIFGSRPFIAMAALSSVRRTTDAAFAQIGREVEPLFECAHVTTVGGLVSNGLGISALPKSVLPLLGQTNLVWRPLAQPVVSRTVGVANWRHFSLSPAAKAFRQSLLAAAKDVDT